MRGGGSIATGISEGIAWAAKRTNFAERAVEFPAKLISARRATEVQSDSLVEHAQPDCTDATSPD
jgi:hypothetical protein